MTEAKLRQLLKKWKFRLGLERWNIVLRIQPCQDEFSYMEVERSLDYQRARITVNPWLLDRRKLPEGKIPEDVLIDPTDDFIEESLVHELLHICTRDLVSIVRHDLDGMVHRDVHRTYVDMMTRADERFVDALAVSLCRAFREGK